MKANIFFKKSVRDDSAKGSFSSQLLHWHGKENKRIMPWKGEKDPYKIWLSEVILQQTRVDQGLSYYERFVEKYPTIKDLALADDKEVFKKWEGLGYYNRCKNLLYTARYIHFELHGMFPSSYKELLRLKGIGPYTAAAISSFAYGLPHAVVDGNVSRVLSRYYGHTIPIDSTQGKIHFSDLADALLDKKHPAVFNQAIMDFGATVCKPKNPLCMSCMFNNDCYAFKHSQIADLPVKGKKIIKRLRWLFYAILVVDNTSVLVRKRTDRDIWQNLYEFYSLEHGKPLTKKQLEKRLTLELNHQVAINSLSPVYEQHLTHQHLKGKFVTVNLSKIPEKLKDYTAVPFNELSAYSFPKFINSYLSTNPVNKCLQNM